MEIFVDSTKFLLIQQNIFLGVFYDHAYYTLKQNLFLSFFFIFSYPCMVENVLIWDQNSEIEILIDLLVLRYLEFGNNILRLIFLCVCVCVPYIRTTQKQIMEET